MGNWKEWSLVGDLVIGESTVKILIKRRLWRDFDIFKLSFHEATIG